MNDIYTTTTFVMFATGTLGLITTISGTVHRSAILILLTWFSIALMPMVDFFTGNQGTLANLQEWVTYFDFTGFVVEGMLCYLLFAGAIHLDGKTALKKMPEILSLAIIATVIAIAVIAGGVMWISHLLGLGLDSLHCWLLGALIAPTDPVSVLALLKTLSVSPLLRTKIAGESLYNDGVGIVIFTALLTSLHQENQWQLSHIVLEFLWVTVGSIGIGILTVLSLQPLIDRLSNDQSHFGIILLTVALVNGLTLLAHQFALSPPLTVVTAGLTISLCLSHLRKRSVEILLIFWEVIDEYMNIILFFFLAIEVVTLSWQWQSLLWMLSSIIICCLARWASVQLTFAALQPWRKASPTVRHLIAGAGLKGALSIALVFSLPPGHARDVMMLATYGVVCFTLLIQGPLLSYWLQHQLQHNSKLN